MATEPTILEKTLQLCAVLGASYDAHSGGKAGSMVFSVEEGRKYYKVIQQVGPSISVHAFVDIATGHVFKPASWKAPAKGIRADLLYNFEGCMQKVANDKLAWTGGWLYIR